MLTTNVDNDVNINVDNNVNVDNTSPTFIYRDGKGLYENVDNNVDVNPSGR